VNQLSLARASNNCGDPLDPVPFGSQHYDVGQQRCTAPELWRNVREASCTSRAQWEWRWRQ